MDALRQVQLGEHLLVALEELDGVPAGQVLGHDAARMHAAVRVVVVHAVFVVVGDQILDVGQRMLHAAGEHVGQLVAHALLRGLGGGLGNLLTAHALQRGGLHDRTAQRLAQLLQIDPVAVLAGHVDHVQRDDHRDSQLRKLGGQVEVALDVRRVHDVENRVRLLVDQIAAGHNFFQCIGGEAVNARQVLNDHVLRALEAALLLFDRHARPVAHVLVAAGQIVEQRGLATIRVAREGNLDCHVHILLQSKS